MDTISLNAHNGSHSKNGAKAIKWIKLEFVEGRGDWRFESFYGGSMGFQGFVKVLRSFKGSGKVWQRLEKRRGQLMLKNS